jgi:hypothetical protein
MEAFDSWIETLGADQMQLPEMDGNVARASLNKRIRGTLNEAPREFRMKYAKKHYLFFLKNRSYIERKINHALQAGKTIQQILDENLK